MSTVAQVRAEHPLQANGDRLWQMLRWVTVALFVLSVAAMLSVGSRQVSYSRLQSGLASGSITDVHIEGALGGPGPQGLDGVTGSSTVRLSWQDGWHQSVAEVVQTSSANEGASYADSGEPLPRIIGPIDTELRTYSPDVHLTWSEARSGVTSAMGGWVVRGEWAPLPLFMLCLLPLLVVTCPEPRLATRWAWFWLIVSPLMPIAVAVFLLYGCRAHEPGRTRLTGWWAFLIMVVTPTGFLAF